MKIRAQGTCLGVKLHADLVTKKSFSLPSSFQLQTIENLQTEKSKNDISVSASLYHGTKPLLSDDESNPTTRLPIKSTFNWNKEFAFGIQIKNLPKVKKQRSC